jgi:Concanavalin A-like lectin/glucanases superfamily/Secretion system C-terminal sorting domain
MQKLLLFAITLMSIHCNFAQTLVASYPFNGNAVDATGNVANNGTVNGATLSTDRFGNPNAAYNFDGIDDFIEGIADNLPSGDRTISLWFNADAGSIATNTPDVFSYGGGGCGSSLLMILNNVNNGKYQVSGHCNSNLNEYTYSALPENKWYNWVVTVNGTTIKMYVDGLPVNTTTNFTTPTNVLGKDFYIGTLINNNGIGRFNPSGGYYFKGKIDDIKIYDGALSDAQVSDLYSTFSLVAYYPFNGNADDQSGNDNHGTENGASLTTDRFGNPNAAYYFDGVDDYIEAAADNLPTGNCTVSLWFKADAGSMAANPGMFGYGGNGGACPGNSHILQLYQSSGINSFVSHAHCGTNQIFYNSPEIPEEKWYNWVVTTSGTTIKMYLNGKLVSTSNANTNPKIVAGKKLNMGAVVSLLGTSSYTDGNVGRFKGVLDDVKIYNAELPASEIFDNYIKDKTKPGSGNGLQLTRTGTRATDPWVNIGSGYDFGAEPFTYETWVKRDDLHTTENNFGIVLIVSESNGGWAVGISNSNTLFFSKVGINASFSTGIIGDTKWHHVALVYTGSELKFYIDGIMVSANSYTDTFNNGGNYTMGARQLFGNINGDQTLNGMIDETRIWKNVALSENEIRDWMCKKITSAHPQYQKLFGYFNFDETTNPIRGFGGHFGNFVNSPILQTSGAAIGNDSDHDYTHTIKSALISHTTGESFLVESITGDPSGIQVYRVDEAPSNLTGHNGLDPFPTYYGVFQAGGTTPTYNATYTYFGNNVGGGEANLRLYSRTNNAATSWTENLVLPDIINDKIVLTGQSTEYILGTATIPLPLNLISFTGKNIETGNLLSWLTANEVALSHFEIENSENGKTFEKIGELKANGGPSEKVYYEFFDLQLINYNSQLFYRLKMVDLDGKFKYSKIINIENKAQSEITIYPNPTSDYFTISGNMKFEKLQIVDASGKVLKEFLPQNGNRYSLAGISAGVYFVKNNGGNSLNINKLIIK